MNTTGIISMALVCLNLISYTPKLGNEKALVPEDISACATYEGYLNPGGEILAVIKDGKCGFIDSDGNTAIPFEYDGVADIPWNFAVIRKGNKYGCINLKNEVLVPFEYDYLFWYKDGHIIARKDKKEGVINLKGEIIIPLVYDSLRNDVYSDSHKVFHVRLNGYSGLIDIEGHFVIPMMFDNLTREERFNNLSRDEMAMTDTFLVAKLGDKYGALDYSGNILLPFEYDSMKVAGEKIVSVVKDKKFAVLDIEGNIIAPYGDKGYQPIGEGFFTRGSYFDEKGMALLNEKGKVVTKEGGGNGFKAYSSGYIIMHYDGNAFLRDFNGRLVTDKDNYQILERNNGYFLIEKNDGTHYLWKDGKKIYPEYEITDVFRIDNEGFICAVNDNLERVYVFSPEGKLVRCFEGSHIYSSDDYYIVEQVKDDKENYKFVPKINN